MVQRRRPTITRVWFATENASLPEKLRSNDRHLFYVDSLLPIYEGRYDAGQRAEESFQEFTSRPNSPD